MAVPLIPTQEIVGRLVCVIIFLLECNLNIVSDEKLKNRQSEKCDQIVGSLVQKQKNSERKREKNLTYWEMEFLR